MSKREACLPQGGQWSMKMTAKSKLLARISAYMAENRIKLALEAEISQNLAFEANIEGSKIFGDDPMG